MFKPVRARRNAAFRYLKDMILAGDIGGTKVNLAFFDPEDLRLTEENLGTYSSHEYGSLEEIACQFMKSRGEPVECACFGIAGPIRKSGVHLTNLPWTLDAQELARALGLDEVWLINDVEANAHGVAALAPSDFVTLNAGNLDAAGNAVLVSAGTGLGEAGLFWDGNRHLPIASEGGHADFGPRTDLDAELLCHLRAQLGQVSWEHVLSGPGCFRIYKFLRDTGRGEEPAWLAQQIQTEDPSVAVTQAGLAGRCELCVQTLDLFAGYYGCEAANLALKFLAVGGVYLGGGIAPKIIQKLKDGAFLKAFVGQSRMKDILSAMPVQVIMNDKTALLGAGRYAALQSGKIL